MATQLVQKWYNVAGQVENQWPENIYGNLLGNDEVTSKISISAPPGTVVQLVSKGQSETPKRILIGQSGIYDFSYEGIEIQEISFPAQTGESILISYVEEAIAQIRSIADEVGESPYTNEKYTEFCSLMRNLLFNVTPQGEDSRSLQDVITSWLEESTQMQGNTNLSNIIVNYILAS